MIRHFIRTIIAAALVMAVPSATGAAQPGQPAAVAPSALDEGLSFLLMDGLNARAILRNRGERQAADSLWTSLARFVAAVRDADPDDKALLLPIVAGFRTGLAQSVIDAASSSPAALNELQAALDDQIQIQTAPGFRPGERGGIPVTVSASSNGTAMPGLYVWADLTGCVPTGMRTGKPVGNVTPARDTLAPGRYLFRVVRGTNASNFRIVGTRVFKVGDHASEDITVEVEHP